MMQFPSQLFSFESKALKESRVLSIKCISMCHSKLGEKTNLQVSFSNQGFLITSVSFDRRMYSRSSEELCD